jgi:hypothetical protein
MKLLIARIDELALMAAAAAAISARTVRKWPMRLVQEGFLSRSFGSQF